VSFLELYNEELTDLLSAAAPADDKDKQRLRLLEDRGGVVVQGLEEAVVKNAAEIYQVLDRGTAKRRTAETLLNKRSSRSHRWGGRGQGGGVVWADGCKGRQAAAAIKLFSFHHSPAQQSPNAPHKTPPASSPSRST
jgi:hypothetical protein